MNVLYVHPKTKTIRVSNLKRDSQINAQANIWVSLKAYAHMTHIVAILVPRIASRICAPVLKDKIKSIAASCL